MELYLRILSAWLHSDWSFLVRPLRSPQRRFQDYKSGTIRWEKRYSLESTSHSACRTPRYDIHSKASSGDATAPLHRGKPRVNGTDLRLFVGGHIDQNARPSIPAFHFQQERDRQWIALPRTPRRRTGEQWPPVLEARGLRFSSRQGGHGRGFRDSGQRYELRGCSLAGCVRTGGEEWGLGWAGVCASDILGRIHVEWRGCLRHCRARLADTPRWVVVKMVNEAAIAASCEYKSVGIAWQSWKDIPQLNSIAEFSWGWCGMLVMVLHHSSPSAALFAWANAM